MTSKVKLQIVRKHQNCGATFNKRFSCWAISIETVAWSLIFSYTLVIWSADFQSPHTYTWAALLLSWARLPHKSGLFNFMLTRAKNPLNTKSYKLTKRKWRNWDSNSSLSVKILKFNPATNYAFPQSCSYGIVKPGTVISSYWLTASFWLRPQHQHFIWEIQTEYYISALQKETMCTGKKWVQFWIRNAIWDGGSK